MKRFLKLFVVLVLLNNMNVYAQKTVCDSYTLIYPMSDTETYVEAEGKAINQARIEMVANNFGTIVSSSSYVTVDNHGSSSRTYAWLDVKGEWLKDTSEPVVRRMIRNDRFVLEVTVSGRIREIETIPIDLSCKLLRNGTAEEYVSHDCRFNHGDKMYMSFRSPCDGYIAIYLYESATREVSCLYPYNGMSVEQMKITGGEEYVFFSKKNSAGVDPLSIKEFRLECDEDKTFEAATLYVVFSPNKFVKANDNQLEDGFRQLDEKDFNKWLQRLRVYDKEMNLRSFYVTVQRK